MFRRALISLAFIVSGCANTSNGNEDAGSTGGVGSDTTTLAPGSTTTNDVDSGSTGGESTGTSEGSSTTGPLEPVQMLLMESVVFYDGYAETVDEPVPDGVIRLSNAVHAVKLSDEQLDVIQPNLDMQVVVGALCDNYDRIGSVHLAMTDKGAETYVPERVRRIEIARFITPFMDMNRQPDTVPYDWDIDEVASILTDPEIRETYDLWLELNVFGVPYAANTEVAGCEDRTDVFRGWLALRTDSTAKAQGWSTLLPLAMKETFNNYERGASDKIGTTRKTVEFELDADFEASQLVLITSNHGANAGGEEYNRRDHFASLDGRPVLEYRPGRPTCEPFRQYNTQGNGIYGPSPRSDEEWQSFSNWCPGDVIDTRIIEVGALSAGPHTFVLDVPDAEFVDGQGNIPFSLYLQAQ